MPHTAFHLAPVNHQLVMFCPPAVPSSQSTTQVPTVLPIMLAADVSQHPLTSKSLMSPTHSVTTASSWSTTKINVQSSGCQLTLPHALTSSQSYPGLKSPAASLSTINVPTSAGPSTVAVAAVGIDKASLEGNKSTAATATNVFNFTTNNSPLLTPSYYQGGVITMEDRNGRSALNVGTVATPTKVKATLASVPIGTESLPVKHSALTLRWSSAPALDNISLRASALPLSPLVTQSRLVPGVADIVRSPAALNIVTSGTSNCHQIVTHAQQLSDTDSSAPESHSKIHGAVTSKPKLVPPPLPIPHHVMNATPSSPSYASPKRSSVQKRAVNEGTVIVLKEVDFDRKFEELPKFNPDTVAIAEAGTPLPKSPRDIVNSYRKKRKQSIDPLTPAFGLEPDLTTTASPRVMSARQRKMSFGGGTTSECSTPKTPKSAVTVGGASKLTTDDRVFFGPNFSFEKLDLANMSRPTFGELEEGSFGSPRTPRSPRTPSSPGGSTAVSLRRVFDTRRLLVMQLFEEQGTVFPSATATTNFQSKHAALFPNKNLLQLKIREVRQRLMAESQINEAHNEPTTNSEVTASVSSNAECSEQPRTDCDRSES
jgi:hypothetical protein